MKAIYKKPITEVVICKCENLICNSPQPDHADSKKGFFDDYDDMLKSSDLWDNNDPFGE